MAFPLTLLDLAGSVALLLWGMRMVQTGVQRAFGARLRFFLDRALRHRLRAFLAGIGVTAVMQSSTATGLMVTGFAAGGMLDLVPALAVMLGANVGTTLIVQVLSFDLASVSPVLILIGVMMFRRATAGTRDFGRVLIGLGLVLLALRQFLSLLTPYEDVPSLRLLLGAVATEPLLDVILAAGLTWAAHSSVAVILLIMSFASKGVIPPQAAFALVLGANLGTALNPVIEGAAGPDMAARRLPVGNLLTRIAGVAVALPLLGTIGAWMVAFEPDNERAVADFHSFFNVALAAIFLPLLTPYAGLLRRWMPARVAASDPSLPIYLDPSAAEMPAVALGGAAREALRMADVLETMLAGFRDAIDRGDRRKLAEIRRMDQVLEALGAAIGSYLVALDPGGMSDGDQQRMQEILCFAGNVEQAGDVVNRNLVGLAIKGVKRGIELPARDKAEMLALIDRILGNARVGASLFVTTDARTARLLAAEKEAFREIETTATLSHLERLRAGTADDLEANSWRLDIIRDLKQVNAHLIAATAYPLLQSKGELLPSRLRQDILESDP